MKRTISFICACIFVSIVAESDSITFGKKKIVYVDIENSTGIEEGTQLNPFNTIQEGIDRASGGDTVFVAGGTYIENIDFFGKAVVLKSEAGATKTKIHGLGIGDVVIGATGCTIQGFTITGSGREWFDCGIQAGRATMTISENIITRNWLGIRTSNFRTPLIQNNLVYKNKHYGIVASQYSAPTIINNTIIKNGDHGVFSASGTGLVANNIIYANRGCGIYCTMASSAPQIRYNDVFKNRGGDYSGCLPGEGDISANPRLKSFRKGYFHLNSTSPCINAGSCLIAPDRDIDLEPRPQNGFVDMGCDEHIPFGTIYGFVVDEKTGLPIRKAEVDCLNIGSCITKKDGYYGFVDVLDGMNRFKARKDGYRMEKAEVDIVGGGSYRQDFRMRPKK